MQDCTHEIHTVFVHPVHLKVHEVHETHPHCKSVPESHLSHIMSTNLNGGKKLAGRNWRQDE